MWGKAPRGKRRAASCRVLPAPKHRLFRLRPAYLLAGARLLLVALGDPGLDRRFLLLGLLPGFGFQLRLGLLQLGQPALPPRPCAHNSSPCACWRCPAACSRRWPHGPASPALPSDTTEAPG